MAGRTSVGFEPAQLTLSRSSVGNAVVIRVSGEIDLNTVERFQQSLETEPVSSALVVDLSAVTFFGSAGLGALVKATACAGRHRRLLRLVVDNNRAVLRPLQVTGLDQLLILYYTVEDAVRGYPDRALETGA